LEDFLNDKISLYFLKSIEMDFIERWIILLKENFQLVGG